MLHLDKIESVIGVVLAWKCFVCYFLNCMLNLLPQKYYCFEMEIPLTFFFNVINPSATQTIIKHQVALCVYEQSKRYVYACLCKKKDFK